MGRNGHRKALKTFLLLVDSLILPPLSEIERVSQAAEQKLGPRIVQLFIWEERVLKYMDYSCSSLRFLLFYLFCD